MITTKHSSIMSVSSSLISPRLFPTAFSSFLCSFTLTHVCGVQLHKPFKSSVAPQVLGGCQEEALKAILFKDYTLQSLLSPTKAWHPPRNIRLAAQYALMWIFKARKRKNEGQMQ